MSTSIRNDKKKNRRSRKKRRTEDFSSDSSDSSDSDSSSHTQEESIEETKIEKPSVLNQSAPKHASLNLDDIDVLSDDEGSKHTAIEAISDETKEKLYRINLTTTVLSNTTGFGGIQMKDVDSKQVKETIAKDKAQLNNEYLMLMASTFGNDLDELRKKPDFTQKSLVILAKALQSGSNMFDEDTLSAILSK